MFDGTTYKRCSCTEPVLDDAGRPVLRPDGKPKRREIGSACPDLKKRDHGSWAYYLNLPDGPRGERRRPRKSGFRTQTDAKVAAQKLWDEAQGGVDIDSKETVAQYLRRWLRQRVDLKRSTRKDYEDYVERIFIPGLGHLPLRQLRKRHIQEMFEQIWAHNETKAANRLAAQQAKAECDDAYRAWKSAPKPRPPHLRQRWDEAKAALREARQKPRRETGPGTQKKFKDTLSAALDAAVAEKLITENFTKGVVLPKYERPEALVWTDERVARWRETGEIPGPVMVWTPQQTGQFLDGATGHRMYPMWHLAVFRATRRGETVGLPWTETDLEAGTIKVVEQLVKGRTYSEVWEDTPKSRSGRRTVTLDDVTRALLRAVREAQKAEREAWEAKHRAEPEKYGPYVNSGRVFTTEDGSPHNPDNVSQAFDRLVKRLGLPPIRLHDLRHCAASLSLAAGLSMKAIQALLGHSNYSLTADTYTSLMPQFDQAAANAPVILVPRANAAEETTAPKLTLVVSGPEPEGAGAADHGQEEVGGHSAPCRVMSA
ncbi:tyrosine-type recombinase/integrase [Streptomyces chrestomyceticus]|uniref:tyrosine-type recombinase/integrase n=1 Tax=Streptomyces chrestomyceticus TaxID=68185 RepID=UPI0033DDD17B